MWCYNMKVTTATIRLPVVPEFEIHPDSLVPLRQMDPLGFAKLRRLGLATAAERSHTRGGL